MIVCSYEDRLSSLTGLKLLVLSMTEHASDLMLDITCPVAPQSLQQWLAQFPNVRLRMEPTWTQRGWNVKPAKLLEVLGECDDEVVWIDTDIIVNRDFRPLLVNLERRHVLVAQEVYWVVRTGLRVGVYPLVAVCLGQPIRGSCELRVITSNYCEPGRRCCPIRTT
jgi:hypothetical protein